MGKSATKRHRNQWEPIRRLRGYTQRCVASCIGHLNVDYYRDIEHGRRLPSIPLLVRLLCVMNCSLLQAYPWLVWDEEKSVKARTRSSPTKKSPPPVRQKTSR